MKLKLVYQFIVTLHGNQVFKVCNCSIYKVKFVILLKRSLIYLTQILRGKC